MYDRPTRRRTTTGFGTCDECGRRVLYALTDKHRKIIAIDPPEDIAGNQAVSIRDTVYWTRQLTKDRPRAEEREVLRKPHFASCPIARARAAARRRTTARATVGVRPVRWQR
ncbi:hypothetical protein JHN59_41550 [Streptomyces sp. MBT49]|uniref:hypothetical protein n=1 Tax=Streptomyces sp. MBT49 TaxID=1488380 RepID=UPI00190DD4AA|nr:hypothetical protein [Streptomyces sp. MBT49]MBK3631158.1 hypothetical protein [Streptomyces sp. MBT49]